MLHSRSEEDIVIVLPANEALDRFWQTDVQNDDNPYESTESKLKDTDPEKEDKCPVIKNINESAFRVASSAIDLTCSR